MTDLPLAHLGETLYRSGYTEPRLRQFWGAATSEALLRNNAAPAIHHCTRVLDDESSTAAERAMACAALLFHFHRAVPVTEVRALLGESFDTAAEAGLIAVDDEVTAPFALTPYDLPLGVPRGFRSGDENLYLVADHGTLTTPDVLDGEFVLGLGGAGRTLVSITPRDHVGTAADIGTGCGIQALLLARHSDRVIATDISHRALRLAELSAGLNSVTTIEFRHGSLLEPLSEPVDLLVSNPPFVITPRSTDTTFEYRDGGRTGDHLVRELFTQIPAHLTPGGRSVCLGNWEAASGKDEGPEKWVGDDDTSVFVIEREALDPIAYAETWIRDGGIPRSSTAWNEAAAAWIDDFATRAVDEIVFGYVLMTRSDNDVPTIDSSDSTVGDNMSGFDRGPSGLAEGVFKTRVRVTSAPANNPHGLAEFLTTIIAIRSWLASAGPEEIAATAFTRSPDLVEHRHFVPGAPEPNSITLEQGIGFGQVFDLDTALAGFVSVADGTLTLRQTAGALAQLLEVDPTALEDQLVAQVRALCAAGALLPDSGSVETSTTRSAVE
ncbi:Methyltransferase small domain-containing protein [Brevibacterium siliguriense]|uniref:Methyltransferase small domain-containing protein n=1 Tax=Brevibacterium siliguriense TaxID=1136497 RepID=A0A1H1X663_9MICO|nr:class I SAM-dependent methyltransferase [Brevibacterium siliguriense]SDT04843.1 Methyltransferase small domain-containing protein [Brevibacterium siliguriense]